MDDYKFIVFFGVAVKGVKLNDLRDGEYSEWTQVHFNKAPNRYDSDCVAVTLPWCGKVLGHVEREAAPLVSSLLNGPFRLHG